MDVSVFKPLKAGWKKGVEKWRFENGGRRMKKEEFAPLLKQVMDDSLKKEVVASGFRATGLGDLDPDKVHYNNLIRNKREETSNNNLAEKLKECKRYLAFTEVKIGLAKVRMFNSGDVLLRDESLYEFWKSIKQEVADLSKKLQERTETENKTGLGAEEVEDEPEVPEDDLTAEAGIILAQATYENEIVDIDLPFFEDLLGEKTSSMEVNVIYHQAHEETNSPPLSEDDIEPTFDIVPVSTPPAASSSCSHSTTAPSTNVSPVRVTSSVSFPTAVPSHSSFSPSTIYPLPSSTSLPNLPSPFKRCLLFPTPLSAKKKKLKGEVMPCTISGDKFKEYMKRKEEKKQEKEKEIKRKREERKEKKKIKEQKTTQKKNVCQKEKIVVEN